MVNLGCLLARIVSNFLALVLTASHGSNNLDLRNDQKCDCLVTQHEQDKGFERD